MSLSFFLAVNFLLGLVSTARDDGPLATISIMYEYSYITGRYCAVRCLWAFDGGLGDELACGGSYPINGCYCKTDYASSATSFLSHCVESNCLNLGGGLKEEVKTIMALYTGYCQTANIDPRTAADDPSAATEGLSTSTVALTTDAQRTALPSSSALPVKGSIPSALASSSASPVEDSIPSTLASSSFSPLGGSTPSAAASTTKASLGSGGLGKSDAIDLGVGLGVGIPSLLLVLAGLWLQLRRRRRSNLRIKEDEQ